LSRKALNDFTKFLSLILLGFVCKVKLRLREIKEIEYSFYDGMKIRGLGLKKVTSTKAENDSVARFPVGNKLDILMDECSVLLRELVIFERLFCSMRIIFYFDS
jgi:hypothetical protein